MVCSEDCLKAAVAELTDGEQGAVAEGREDVGVTCSERELWEWKQGGMCRLDAVAVGKHDEDAVGDGLEVGAGAVQAEEVRGTAGVGDSCVFGARRDGRGEDYGIKAKRCVGRIVFNFIVLGRLSFGERLG